MSWRLRDGVWLRSAGPGAPVLVLHDAQNLFDPGTSTDGTTWELDAALEELATPLTIVALPHAGTQRSVEYVGSGLDAHVDRVLAALPESPGPVGIGGSSFGAYASLYAWARHPDVFDRVLAMSPALWVRRDRVFEAVRVSALTGEHRVWIDVGGREHDDPAYREEYLAGYREMRDLLELRGCRVGGGIDDDAIHHESAWAERLPGALRFLYGD